MANALDVLLCLLTLTFSFWKTLIFAIIPAHLRTPKSIKGEVALVTGGGNGLGRQLALRLAKMGVSVVIWDVDETGLEETCARIRAEGGQAKGYVCDVSERSNIYKTAAQVKEDVGRITILVNNAGLANGKFLLDIPEEAFEKVINVNFMSQVWTCKAFLPDMIKSRKGHIVAISSMAGHCAMVKGTEYVSSKHAVVGFMDSLKLELLDLGCSEISMTTVCPYFINTGMFECKYDGIVPMLTTTEVVDKIVEGILLNKERVVIPRRFYLVFPWKAFMNAISMLSLQNAFGGRQIVETIKLNRSPSN